jgi:hypothetical protein
VKKLMGGETRAADRPAFVYVYAPAKGESHDLQPADQIAVLRRLSSFSDKEAVPVTVIFTGRPLRKVPDGARQGSVLVRYAMPDDLARMAEQSVQEAAKQHHAVLVTDRADIGKIAARLGARLLRTVTFEKTLEAVSGPLKREPKEPREQRDQKEPRKPQPEAAPPPAQDAAPAPEQAPPPPPPKAMQYDPVVPKKETDAAILDLIDPL